MTSEQRHPTEQEAIEAAGRVFAAGDAAMARMTPREQAEAAWTPTFRGTVEDLEDRIRARRGLPPLDRGTRTEGGETTEARPDDGI